MQAWRAIQEMKYLDRENNMLVMVRVGDKLVPAYTAGSGKYCPACKVHDPTCSHEHVKYIEFKP